MEVDSPNEQEEVKYQDSGLSDQSFNEEVVEEERKLKSNIQKTKQQLISIRNDMIVNGVETQHEFQSKMLKALFIIFIDDQIEDFMEDHRESTYFLNKEDPQLQLGIREMINTHKKQLKIVLVKGYPSLPNALINLAGEMFEKKATEMTTDEPKQVSQIDTEDFIDDWKQFLSWA